MNYIKNDETVKTTQKYNDLKLDFWFLHLIRYLMVY